MIAFLSNANMYKKNGTMYPRWEQLILMIGSSILNSLNLLKCVHFVLKLDGKLV
jgi:hypothetical protein